MKLGSRIYSACAALLFAHALSAFGHWPDQAPHRTANFGEFELEGGGVIPDLKMSYVTHGKLNAAKDNAILFMHGFGLNHHQADHLIGPAGRSTPTSTSSSARMRWAARKRSSNIPPARPQRPEDEVPSYNLRDKVKAKYRLLTQALGIPHLLAVTGISAGAIHSVQFAVSYPDFMDAIFPIVGGALWRTEAVFFGVAAWFRSSSPVPGGTAAITTRIPGMRSQRPVGADSLLLHAGLVGPVRRYARGLHEMAQQLGRLLPRHPGCTGSVLPAEGRRARLGR